MHFIKFLVLINSPREKIYEALSTIEGLKNWWTQETTGESKVGSHIEFCFKPPAMIGVKVISLVENESVTWVCSAGAEDWIGTIISFRLDIHEGMTRLRFEQTGFRDAGDFYASCAFSWARYLESLRQFCQTGQGEAYGSPRYRG